MKPLSDLMDKIEAEALVWMKGWWQPSLNGIK
jgi:hypothetical protein